MDRARELLDKLSESPDFPAFSRVIARVNEIAKSETCRNEELAEIVLRDVALTQRLLRTVNAAHFRQFSEQPISTVSRAIIVLGFAAIRDAAVSLMLFERMEQSRQTAGVRADAARGLHRGLIGRELARAVGGVDQEEAFIAAMLLGLGRMTARMYLPDSADEVERLVADGLSEEKAAAQVFGLSYPEISVLICKHWGMPAGIMASFDPPGETADPKYGRLQHIVHMASSLSRVAESEPMEAWQEHLPRLLETHGKVLPVKLEEVFRVMLDVGDSLQQEGTRYGIVVDEASPLLRAQAKGGGTDPTADPLEMAEVPRQDAIQWLTDGMNDLSCLVMDGSGPGEVIGAMAELFFGTRLFDYVAVFALGKGGGDLLPRLVLGADKTMLGGISVPARFSPDVFGVATGKGLDVLISDCRAGNIADKIPPWHQRAMGAASFLLLPIQQQGRTIALIYCGARKPGLRIPENTLKLIKSIRNQTTLAIRPTKPRPS